MVTHCRAKILPVAAICLVSALATATVSANETQGAGPTAGIGGFESLFRGTSSTNDEMMKRITDEAESGNIQSEIYLGEYYERSNPSLSIYWYTMAAKKNSNDAARALVVIYLRDGNTDMALSWLRTMVDNGSMEAAYDYGNIVLRSLSAHGNTNNDKSIAEGLKYMNIAANGGSGEALHDLAGFYFSGRFVPKNSVKALELELKAAKTGNVSAMMGLYFVLNQPSLTEKDTEEARNFLLKETEGGNMVASDVAGMSMVFAHGFQKDEKKGAELVAASANSGVVFAEADLGFLYRNGLGVAKDDKKATEWYEKAAEAGSMDGLYNAAMAYINGVGVDKNPGKGVELLRKAAEKGLASAQFNLAKILLEGKIVPVDESDGVRFLTAAANSMLPDADYMLGMMYIEGRVVEKNTAKGSTYVKLAAMNGNKDAISEVEKLGIGSIPNQPSVSSK